MSTVIISGGSGLLGVNWAIRRRSSDDIHILLNDRMIQIEGVTCHKVDLSCLVKVREIINKIKPDLIIHTAGFTNVDGCEFDPGKSLISNVKVASNLAKACSKYSIKLVHISTDHLFDGLTQYKSEIEETRPQNVYGRHKGEAEKKILNSNPEALIVRSNFFGWGPSYRRSISDLVIDSLKNSINLQMFDDVFFTPISMKSLIELTHALIDKKQSGVFNICSNERLSKYEFSVRLANKFNFDGDCIQPIQSKRLIEKIKRPKDLSLSSNKLVQTLKIQPISIEKVMNDLKEDMIFQDEISRIGKIIPYGKHYVDQDDITAVTTTLKSSFLTQGPTISTFEGQVADYVGAKYAVAVSSATAGLHLAYLALGVGPKKNIITSPNTFVATANASLYCGGGVSFSDINIKTKNIDSEKLKRLLESGHSSHLVAPVLFSGAADGIPEACKVAKAYGKAVVEDAAQGLGGSYFCGSKVGSCKYSDCTVFSLHPVKSIAAGEGGVITTNDKEIYRSLLRLRSHGINKIDDPLVDKKNAFTDGKPNIWYYEMSTLGYHYRLTDIQAALASSQICKLDLFINKRRELAHRYVELLEPLDFICPSQKVDIDKSANHLFTVSIDYDSIGKSRNDFMHSLREHNIVTQVHYIPVHTQPFYKNRGFKPIDFPNSMAYYEQALSLPLYFSLSYEEQDFVVEKINDIIQKKKHK